MELLSLLLTLFIVVVPALVGWVVIVKAFSCPRYTPVPDDTRQRVMNHIESKVVGTEIYSKVYINTIDCTGLSHEERLKIIRTCSKKGWILTGRYHELMVLKINPNDVSYETVKATLIFAKRESIGGVATVIYRGKLPELNSLMIEIRDNCALSGYDVRVDKKYTTFSIRV